MSQVYIRKTIDLVNELLRDPDIPEAHKAKLRGHLIMGRLALMKRPTTDKVVQLYTDAKE
jgi:hypothetical protein